MSDVKTAIMDAAEQRMQLGGFGGFSFREIAADVGIKSSSVHYHFPTKEDLAAAVIRRWAEATSNGIGILLKLLIDVFRGLFGPAADNSGCEVLLRWEVIMDARTFDTDIGRDRSEERRVGRGC